ncbi:MAG: NAD(P)H-binding protein [Alcanivorax sp.]|uniref:NAD(P)H-binding protein n=1 Tax=Alloalcanivorax marinus TaxID=1177169 RepID=A0A9Q3UNF8_9GAMM|nr:NAD(P)H-binding protein [Alloalcanivorax marinus]MBM7331985.1 NAD(P)H-binding protein [Alloalcanivorax marinus]MCC4309191.1 NAD(P)H-binding protein [Alloalcanivorax marinus]
MDTAPITVFGGTGFLGRRLVTALLQRGHAVRLAARRPERVRFHDETRLERRVADVTDDRQVAAAVAGSRTVVNAVSLYAEQGDLTFRAIHVESAERVALAARRARVPRLLHLSGIGVSDLSPSPYVRARAQGEMAVRETCPGATLVRPASMFGAGDALVRALATLSRLPVLPLFGRGRTCLQPVWVQDVAGGLATLATWPGAPAPLYELAGGEVLRYRDMVVAVRDYLGRRGPTLPLPFEAWHLMAAVARRLPGAPLTRDQVFLMEEDNVAAPDVPGFIELDRRPRGFREGLPDCLGPRPR